jgi:hypothetical protein
MSGFERFNIDSKFDYDISKYEKLIQNYKNNPYLYLNRRYDMYTKGKNIITVLNMRYSTYSF